MPTAVSGWRHACWTLLTIALIPVLVVQTVWAIKRTPKMPEPPGARVGESGPDTAPPLRLLILGDSSAAGVGVDHQDQALLGQLVGLLSQDYHLHWELVAKTGATIQSTYPRLAAVPDHPVDLVVIGLGVNDVTHLVAPTASLDHMTALLDLIATKLGNPRVLLSGLPPVGKFPALAQPLRMIVGYRARRLDALLRRHIADRADVVAMPFNMPLTVNHMSTDGFHPGPTVYQHWAEEAHALWQQHAIDPHRDTA